jgi:hypothetical protein
MDVVMSDRLKRVEIELLALAQHGYALVQIGDHPLDRRTVLDRRGCLARIAIIQDGDQIGFLSGLSPGDGEFPLQRQRDLDSLNLDHKILLAAAKSLSRSGR